MSQKKYTCLLLSDFNLDNFAQYLTLDKESPQIDLKKAPFGQVRQILIDHSSEYWSGRPDCAVIWTSPAGIFSSFSEMLNFKNISTKQVFQEIDEFSSLLLSVSEKVKYVFVPTWSIPSYYRGWGMLDMREETGISNTLMKMNLRLSENLSQAKNIYLLNTQKWVETAGENAFHPKLWYMAKIPFSNEVFKEAVKDIKSALQALSGQAKKIIILDLDDTLWGGIVGDLGWENLQLGGHDPIGEALVDFQKALKALSNRGVLFGIVSKNEESIALEAIKKHKEMVLALTDFAGWRINWQDKVENIIDLVSELNLGLQSVVFIDDNPVERARVREALPEVFVPDWPENKMDYPGFLMSLRCFDIPSLNWEDRERTKMYLSERQRDELKRKVTSVEDWLKNLEMRIKVEELNEANLSRTTQLLNKTNQMNLSTRRMTESELTEWIREGERRKVWVFYLADKFGNSGLTGIISLEVKGKEGRIVDFVLSCRVIGRKVEEVMLHTIIKYARFLGLEKIYSEYIPTSKNKPCLRFFESSGFIHNKNNIFIWKVDKDYKIPSYIEIIE